jgi:hypothetical protein
MVAPNSPGLNGSSPPLAKCIWMSADSFPCMMSDLEELVARPVAEARWPRPAMSELTIADLPDPFLPTMLRATGRHRAASRTSPAERG